jgi:outer membrane lipoprotein
MHVLIVTILSVAVLTATGCSGRDVIPENLKGQVDRDLRYVEVNADPEAYRGKLMLAGGKVLSARRLKEGTRIEVLQIPLSSDLIPEEGKHESNGRFVVMGRGENAVDPAIVEDGKLITVVGEVLGSTVINIDEVQSRVPELAMKHVTVWDLGMRRAYYPYRGFYPPYALGYGPMYGYPYYW